MRTRLPSAPRRCLRLSPVGNARRVFRSEVIRCSCHVSGSAYCPHVSHKPSPAFKAIEYSRAALGSANGHSLCQYGFELSNPQSACERTHAMKRYGSVIGVRPESLECLQEISCGGVAGGARHDPELQHSQLFHLSKRRSALSDTSNITEPITRRTWRKWRPIPRLRNGGPL